MSENEVALALWNEVKTQFRASGGGLVGLDYPAVREEARDMGLCFEGSLKKKIKVLEYLTLKKQSETDGGAGGGVIKPGKGHGGRQDLP